MILFYHGIFHGHRQSLFDFVGDLADALQVANQFKARIVEIDRTAQTR